MAPFVSLVLLIVLARTCEALMDAIDHNKGELKLGLLWHSLKFPRALAWLGAGGVYFMNALPVWHIIAAIAIAWPLFELSLRWFRRIDWRRYPWA